LAVEDGRVLEDGETACAEGEEREVLPEKELVSRCRERDDKKRGNMGLT
jgi:hypothetical protein